MKQYPHVEDYIELLAGYEPTNMFGNVTLKFSLARYDVAIVESMANATMWNSQAYTDRQGELAIKLVLKYKRQFANQGIDISPVEEKPVWRFPLRTIDRSHSIYKDNDEIIVKFPYNSNYIKEIKDIKDQGNGKKLWDHAEKVWRFGITEDNVNWLVTWGRLNHFKIDDEIVNLYNKILEVEKNLYEIKLIQLEDRFEITNAADSLIEYVNSHLGGFGLDNLVRLVDNAGVLGYTVDTNIQYPDLLNLFGNNRTVHVPSTEDGALDLIFDYAELTNRWPVCIYNPGTTTKIDLSRFAEDEIVRFDPAGRTRTADYNYYTTKVIYANKIPKHWNYPISLLVSTVEMMYGGKRMEWMQTAEKIIHYSYIPLREKN